VPKITISARDMVFALRNRMPGTTHYLDTTTGQIIPAFAYNRTRLLASVRAERDRYMRLAPESSRRGYEIMRDFIGTISREERRRRFEDAVAGENAFRNFREVLDELPAEKKRWERYRAEMMGARIREKLREMGIEMELDYEDSGLDHPTG
jgi:hypothetical protein